MKILTLNCNLAPWKLDRNKRIPLITNFIIIQNPDIVCFQEVFFKKDGSIIINKLKKKGYKYKYHVKNLLILSKLNIKNKRFFEFKEQGRLISYSFLDRVYRKAFQIIEINNKFLIINCHLLSAKGKNTKHYNLTRIKQIKEIIKYLEKIKNKKIILTGDFNFDVNSKPYNLLKKFTFYDSLRNTKGNTHKNKRLDHFFIKNFKKQKTKGKITNISKKISDHHALILKTINL